MKISELRIRQGNVEAEGTIKEIGDVRTFDRFGRQIRVADAILEDKSGTIKLSLWNEDVDNFKVGDRVKVVNGYVNEFQGEKQLTAGKFGKLKKVGESEEETTEEEPIEEGEEAESETEEEIGEDEEEELEGESEDEEF